MRRDQRTRRRAASCRDIVGAPARGLQLARYRYADDILERGTSFANPWWRWGFFTAEELARLRSQGSEVLVASQLPHHPRMSSLPVPGEDRYV